MKEKRKSIGIIVLAVVIGLLLAGAILLVNHMLQNQRTYLGLFGKTAQTGTDEETTSPGVIDPKLLETTGETDSQVTQDLQEGETDAEQDDSANPSKTGDAAGEDEKDTESAGDTSGTDTANKEETTAKYSDQTNAADSTSKDRSEQQSTAETSEEEIVIIIETGDDDSEEDDGSADTSDAGDSAQTHETAADGRDVYELPLQPF